MFFRVRHAGVVDALDLFRIGLQATDVERLLRADDVDLPSLFQLDDVLTVWL